MSRQGGHQILRLNGIAGHASSVLRVVPQIQLPTWWVTTRTRVRLVSDASHAATAIEAGATWVSFDRDFARSAELTWRVPGRE